MSAPLQIELRDGFQNQNIERVLEDILVRFVVNTPPENLAENSRVFFLFEEAHWFYLDYIRTINPYLPALNLKNFAKKLIELFPFIWKGGDPDEALKEFLNYKNTIPVRGAALFNESLTKVLLVQGTESPTWSFPRGKISKDEDDVTCAIREVEEEIGFDIQPYVDENDFIERTIRGKNYKIYLVKNIPEDFNFQPIVRNEIASIEWRDFKKIPKLIKNSPGKFFLVNSMIKPIYDWIRKNKGEVNEIQLKRQVEVQLKYLLGVGQDDEAAVDPGRELLEFIRKSTTEKQLKEEQQNANPANLQQHQYQQQQFLQQQHLQNPLPNYGFQPPSFQQLPFISPFAPPPPGFINALPAGPFPFPPPPHFGLPQYPPIPILPPHQQFPQQAQQLQAPNPSELSRPSQGIRQRNEQQSKELLSILNSGGSKQNNAKELLNLFHKNKTGTGQTPKKISLLKRDDGQKPEEGKDYSKNLLALLNKKETSPNKSVTEKAQENAVVDKQPEQTTPAPKPKIKLLKREERLEEVSAQSVVEPKQKIAKHEPLGKATKIQLESPAAKQRGESFVSTDENEGFHQSAPPSRELLQLIQKSKQNNDEEFEIFEEFSDEEFEFEPEHDEHGETGSNESVRDDNEVDESIDPSQFSKIDPEYEDEQYTFDDQLDAVEDSKDVLNNFTPSTQHYGSSQYHSLHNNHVQTPPVSASSAAPPKKLKLLKRGEELAPEPEFEAPSNTDNDNGQSEIQIDEHQEPEVQQKDEAIPDDASGTSTIQFSDDDDDDEDDEHKFEDSRAEIETSEEEQPDEKFGSETPVVQPTVDTQATNSLLNLLQGSKSSIGTPTEHHPLPDVNSLSTTRFATPLHDLPANGVNDSPKNDNASNSLLSLLKGQKQESHEVVQLPSQQQTPSSGGAEILNILHGNKSPDAQKPPAVRTPSGGADLLSILHKNKSPESQTSQPDFLYKQQPQEPAHPQFSSPSSGGAELLGLLHKNKSPEPSQHTFQHDKSSAGTPANDLLGLLHKTPTPKQPEPELQPQPQLEPEPEQQPTSPKSKGASFLEFLMRK